MPWKDCEGELSSILLRLKINQTSSAPRYLQEFFTEQLIRMASVPLKRQSKRSRVTMWLLFQKPTFNQVAPSLRWSANRQLRRRSRRLKRASQEGASAE